MQIVLAILIFSVIVIIHELGHFLLAKKNGITVTEFSVGMGPRIISTVKRGTRYSIKLLPIGGSCMMLGEDEESTDRDAFGSKSVWARISVIAAGPIFNFLLAFILSIIIIGVIGYDPAEITVVAEGSAEAEAGLQVGDIITNYNGKPISIARDLATYIEFNGVQEGENTLTVKRDGKKQVLTYTPVASPRYMIGFSYYPDATPAELTSVVKGQAMAAAGLVVGDIITGIGDTPIANGEELSAYLTDNPLSNQPMKLTYEHNGNEKTATLTPTMTEYVGLGFTYNMGRVKTSPLGVLKYAVIEVKYCIQTTFESLVMLVQGKFSVNDLSGPVGVVNIIGENYEKSKSSGPLITVLTMLNLSLLLSANLGVMNLLPLPALDGGRLVFLCIEAVRRKPVSQQKEGMVHFIGLVLLMVLMVFVMFNDIKKIF